MFSRIAEFFGEGKITQIDKGKTSEKNSMTLGFEKVRFPMV